MSTYTWGIETADGNPDNLTVDYGNHVQVDLVNQTNMAHPIHFRGHHVQFTQQNGTDFTGTIRDTVYVAPKGNTRVIFDTRHSGFWPVHCHLLYHTIAGMITEMEYNIQR